MCIRSSSWFGGLHLVVDVLSSTRQCLAWEIRIQQPRGVFLRNSEGPWLFEFDAYLGFCSSLHAELCVVYDGLAFCLGKGHRRVVVEVDFAIVAAAALSCREEEKGVWWMLSFTSYDNINISISHRKFRRRMLFTKVIDAPTGWLILLIRWSLKCTLSLNHQPDCVRCCMLTHIIGAFIFQVLISSLQGKKYIKSYLKQKKQKRKKKEEKSMKTKDKHAHLSAGQTSIWPLNHFLFDQRSK